MEDSRALAGGAAAQPGEDQTLTTRSGLRLRMRPLTPEEAQRHFWVAFTPYSWTNRRFAETAATCWPTRAACAGLAALAAWRCRPAWPWLLACALTPTALLHSLRLLLWLISTRRLPDYADFAGFWCGGGPNRLYGVFLEDRAADGSQPLIGTVASLHLDEATCELQRLAVLPAHRGHGIGDSVCRRLMLLCASSGYRRMQLGTTKLQQHAIDIYERLGFVRIGQFRSIILPGVPIYRYEVALPAADGLD